MAMLACMQPAAAPAATVVTPEARPWGRLGMMVDANVAASGSDSAVGAQRATLDLMGGVRVAGHWRLRWPAVAGLELALRSSAPVDSGASPLLPVATRVPTWGSAPPVLHRVVRQQTSISAAGVWGVRMGHLDMDMQAFVMAGPSGSWRTLLISLDRPAPYVRSYPTVGGFVGAGAWVALGPAFVRSNVLVFHERAPPLGTAGVTQRVFEVAAGTRW